MNRSTPNPLFTALLLFVSLVFFAMVMWIMDNPFPTSWNIIAVLMGLFFITFLWGFLRILRARDIKNSQLIQSRPSAPPPLPTTETEGTVYGLYPGWEYIVVQSFTDYYGNIFEVNQKLKFKGRHFLPYQGGHTIMFEECSLYLQEDQNKNILDNFSSYIVKIKQ